MDFEEGLVVELTSVSGLNGKVFPNAAPEGISPNYLVYVMTDKTGLKTLTGIIGPYDATFEMLVASTTYAGRKLLMSSVLAKIKALAGQNIGTSGPLIQSVDIPNEQDEFESKTNYYAGVIECRFSYE